MTQVQMPARSSSVDSSRWAGWILFATVMLVVTGAINMAQGFVAFFKHGYFLASAADELVLTNFTAWGVVMVVWGALLIMGGLSLQAGRPWARWFTLVVTCLSIMIQIGFLAAYPIWTAIIITFDVLVIFALTAHWDEAAGV